MAFDAGTVKGQLSFDHSSFTKATKSIKKDQVAITKTTKTAGTAFKGMWKQVAAGVGVTALVTSGIRMIGDQLKDTIRKGREFEDAWSSVNTMISDTSINTVDLRDELINLSPTLGSTTDLAKGMYQVLSASVEPAAAIEFLGEAAKSAKAGVTDVATSVDALTTVINAYGMEASDVTKVSDVMFQTVKRGKLTYGELATSLGTVVPIAANLGVNFTDIAASMSTMTRQGIDASTATMQLRQVLMSILTPSESAKILAKDLGIELGANALKTKGLVGWLKELREKTGGSADAMGKLVPNARALTGVMALAGERIGEMLGDQKLMNAAFVVGGQTTEAFTKKMRDATFWMDAGKEATNKFKTAFYLGFVEPFKQGITNADELDKVTADLTKTFGDLGESLGTLAKMSIPILGKQLEIWTGHLNNIFLVAEAVIHKVKGGTKAVEDQTKAITKATWKDFISDTLVCAKAQFEVTGSIGSVNAALDKEKGALDAGSSAWEKLQARISETKVELTAYEKFVKDQAILTIAEKSAKVTELEGFLETLHQEYKDGKWAYQEYIKVVEQTKTEIAELSTVVVNTAIPAARDLSGALADAPGEVSKNTQEAIIEVGKSASSMTEIFGQVSERIRDKWTTELGSMLAGATSFKDGMNSIWTTVKQQFFDLLAQMLTKYTLKFVGGILSGASEAASGLLGSIGGALGGLFGGGEGGGGGGGIGGLIGGGGGMLASPWTTIAAGLGGVLGGLLGGDKSGHDIKMIKDNTWEMKMDLRNVVNNQDFLKSRADWTHGELTTVNAQLNSIKISSWSIGDSVGRMKNTLWRVETILKNITSAALGYKSTKTELVVVHGTPDNPEYIIPHEDITDLEYGQGRSDPDIPGLPGGEEEFGQRDRPDDPGLIGGGTGGGGGAKPRPAFDIKIKSVVNLIGTIITDREHTREAIIPEMIAAFEANIRKVDFLESLGIPD